MNDKIICKPAYFIASLFPSILFGFVVFCFSKLLSWVHSILFLFTNKKVKFRNEMK